MAKYDQSNPLKCKRCGSPMKFDDLNEDSQTWECPDCGEIANINEDGTHARWQSEEFD